MINFVIFVDGVIIVVVVIKNTFNIGPFTRFFEVDGFNAFESINITSDMVGNSDMTTAQLAELVFVTRSNQIDLIISLSTVQIVVTR